jgi:[acyl-carrier-protein] S-malonyltransferase
VAPTIPVLNNVDVVACSEPQAIRDALYRQAFGPVRWVELVQAMRPRGVLQAIECGPGKVLSGAIKRIDPDLSVGNVQDPASLTASREALA